MSLARGYSLDQLYASANEFYGIYNTFKRHKIFGLSPSDLYTSSGIINAVDPLASAYNLYIISEERVKIILNCYSICRKSIQKYCMECRKFGQFVKNSNDELLDGCAPCLSDIVCV